MVQHVHVPGILLPRHFRIRPRPLLFLAPVVLLFLVPVVRLTATGFPAPPQYHFKPAIMPIRPCAKRWVFTLNNPSTSFEDDLQEYADSHDTVQYFAGQREIAPTTGTEHIQGHIIFTKRLTLVSVRKILDNAHWEVAKGTHEQIIAYVHKLETRKPDSEPFEWGVLEIKV